MILYVYLPERVHKSSFKFLPNPSRVIRVHPISIIYQYTFAAKNSVPEPIFS